MRKSIVPTTSDNILSVSPPSSKRGLTVLPSRYRWPSRWFYISTFMSFAFTLQYLDTLVTRRGRIGLTIIHYVISFTFVGLPFLYLQLLLGQYTQGGVGLIRHMSPIGHGVSISFIILMFMHCVKNGLLLSDATMYFLQTFRKDLQWMKCPDDLRDVCWNGTGCSKNCLSNKVLPSTHYYFIKLYMEDAVLNPNKTTLIGMPAISRTILISSSWITTCLIIALVYTFHRQFVVILWNMCFALLTFNIIISVPVAYSELIGESSLHIDARRIFNMKSWATAITRPVTYMGLGRAYHIMHGSYMSPKTPSGFTATLAVFFNVFILWFTSIFSRCRLIILRQHANSDDEHDAVVWEPGVVTYFINIPMSFGLLSVPHFWLLQYFFLCILILLNNQVTHIITFEAILSDHYSTLVGYRRYVMGGIAICAGLISLILSSKETYVLYKSFIFHIIARIEMANALCLSIVVCYVYGVQKVSDDIHFMTGVQPTKFWKACWYAMPFLFVFAHSTQTHDDEQEYTLVNVVEHWIVLINVSPIIIAAAIEIFRYMKKRNILGIFQSQEMYGPPDPRERYLRRLFNPRRETKSQRRVQICNHKCFLGNKILSRAMDEEMEYKQSTVT